MSKTYKYSVRKQLSDYVDGTVIKDVPITHPILAASLHVADDMTSRWWKVTDKLLRDFDPDLFEPIRYCKNCEWIEDGVTDLW